VRKSLRKILSELPRRGPVMMLRLRRRFGGLKAGKARRRAKA
jgi:hypothetical protein